MNKHEVTCGDAIREIASAVEKYCDAYAMRFDGLVGSDYIVGKEGVEPILRALRVLLNGDTGKLDCGQIDGHILDIASRNGMDLES